MSKYYISFVVATRNDNHGGNMELKNQAFINDLSKKIKKHNLSAEIIVIEWNPTKNKKKLSKKIIKPKLNKNQNIRIITVPNKVHKKFKNSKKINFFQMIAKNVGVRKAMGEYILTTNIDIIFSDQIIEYFSKKKLNKNIIYRCDRYDTSFNNLEKEFSDKKLEKKIFLINKKNYTINVKTKKKYFVNFSLYYLFDFYMQKISKFNRKKLNIKLFSKLNIKLFSKLIKKIYKSLIHKNLFTNTSGDFILLDKKSWYEMRGFEEYDGYSWHLDSIFIYIAYYNYQKKISFLKHKIYHLPQGKGSGYSPTDAKLFKNLIKKNINFISDKDLDKIKEKIIKLKYKRINTNNSWGLKNYKI